MMAKRLKSVFILARPNSQYHKMFAKSPDWYVRSDALKADLIQFTGGPDVSPSLYGEAVHPKTFPNMRRDTWESLVFKLAFDNNIPMAGICRGAQFLNVMSGGALFQHIDGHQNGVGHKMTDLMLGDEFSVNSTHHQGMIPGEGAIIIGEAYESESRERCVKLGTRLILTRKKDEVDFEILYYPYSKSFCFQPHPEYTGVPELTERYFDYLGDYCFNSVDWMDKPELLYKEGS